MSDDDKIKFFSILRFSLASTVSLSWRKSIRMERQSRNSVNAIEQSSKSRRAGDRAKAQAANRDACLVEFSQTDRPAHEMTTALPNPGRSNGQERKVLELPSSDSESKSSHGEGGLASAVAAWKPGSLYFVIPCTGGDSLVGRFEGIELQSGIQALYQMRIHFCKIM